MADINLLGVGANNNIEAQVDPTFQSLRVVVRPAEFSGGGFYSLTGCFLNTAGAFNTALSPMLCVRWTDSSKQMILKRLLISVSLSTVFTNAQVLDYDVIKGQNYTTAPSGGTSIAPNSTSNRRKSSGIGTAMTASSFVTNGTIQIAGTGAIGGATGTAGTALSTGAVTLDAQPFGYAGAMSQNAAAASATQNLPPCVGVLYEYRNNADYPQVFGAGEGFVIRNVTAYGAAGVVKHGFILEWAEVSNGAALGYY